jgi:uncharacterized membrane protein YidH (DUF202 family)
VNDTDVLPGTSAVRRSISILVFTLGVAIFAICIYGAVNPNNYVVLLKHFHNPALGPVVAIVALLIAWVVGFPVRSTVVDRKRSQVRTTLIVLLVVACVVFAFVYLLRLFKYQPDVIATSPSGNRAIAVVDNFSGSEIHVYVGHGLSQRDVASLGLACGLPGSTSATFVGENEIKISTTYNSYDIHLDPASGTPLNHFGATCSD